MWTRARPSKRRSTLFHLVVFAGDGTRVLRLAIPRRALHGGLVVAAVGTIGVALLLGDNAALRAARRTADVLADGRAAQHDTIARLQDDRDAMRRELSSWPVLETAIVSALGRRAAMQEAVTRGAAADADDLTGTLRRATGTLRRVATLMRRFEGVLAQLPSHWPVRAAINSEFGRRRSPWTGEMEAHHGLDLATGYGAPVRAPAPGSIAFTGTNAGYGLTVVVQHGRDIATRYAHLSRVGVRRGDRVDRGQVLGWSGNTGRSTGAHLHYEVIVAGRRVDPRPYLWD
jgi:murein DD-endopeptidase MepM/ murein hydrolase activator NlpD